MDERTDSERKPPSFSAQDARGAEIILRSRRRRVIFVAGLAGLAVLALILAAFVGLTM